MVVVMDLSDLALLGMRPQENEIPERAVMRVIEFAIGTILQNPRRVIDRTLTITAFRNREKTQL
ncbi:MAG: hypothetical protein ACREJU_18280 [Nitrospiraceae bacterium]